MRWVFMSAFGLSLLLSTHADAQLPSGTRAEELNSEIDQADEALNATYQFLMRQMKPSDQARLRTAELAWIKFRDADCAYGWWDTRDCRIQRTDEREKQLRASHFRNAQGKPIRFPPAH